ncbi:MAG: molybdopterin-dependent oxidoreductase [Coriobacteriales bacterium]|jgi:nitrate reductase NapA|nr:molybdopterin-dependent oxidoreductase [Coriobacteriales bacterium]
MELSRRSFIKASAVSLAVAAAGALAGCAPQGGAPGGVTAAKSGTFKSVCRFCGTGCGVICEVKNGRLASVLGDPDNASNKGLNCIKGLHLAKILYGEDRLTKPLVRDDATTKGTTGGLREATWEEALDLVADKLKTAWEADKKRIAFWGSGQQPITEGYALAKFWKAGLLSNNIDPNARLCMASAVVAFMNVFQTDEPPGSYSDLDEADVFVTWGANMAEAHPVLYSRLTARKIAGAGVQHFDITTLKTRTSASADKVLVFRPGTDLAIANAISNYLIQNDLYDKQFVADHVQFKVGAENIGHAYEDGYDGSDVGKTVNDVTPVDFEAFAARMSTYTLDYAAELSGVAAADIEELARLFADPDKRIMSLWTMGVNQHTRGTWMNHCIYNIHLLAGKICKPGSGPFSLTGQPTACGTAREVGLFAHRLPADLVVNNPQHRRYTEAVWDLPSGYLDAIQDPGFHTIRIFREMSKGNIDFLWTASNNWAASLPNLTRFLGKSPEYQGVFKTFIVVNEVYPTLSTQYADVVLPAAMWVEREGQFGNAERRTAVFEKAVDPPGEAKWDVWIFLQVARRVLDGTQIGGAPAFDHLFGFIWDKDKDDFSGDDREINRRLFEEYRIFSNPSLKPAAAAINSNEGGQFDAGLKMENKQLAPYDVYLEHNGLTWPVREVNGTWLPTTWRFADGSQAEGFDEVGIAAYGKKGLAGNISFYKSAGQKPSAVFRPYEAPAEQPDDQYPFWLCTGRLLEQWHTGSMTRRVPELDRALPEALLDMNPEDCQRLGIKDGDLVRVTSRHGQFEIKASTARRTEPGPGTCFAPFFVEENLVNLAVEDYYCPLSKEPDYKKTCVRIEKA